MRLRVERHDGQEGRGGLEDVVAGEVFGRRPDRDRRAGKDLKADLGPAAFERLEVDAAVDERLGEVAAPRLERVDADRERAGSVGGGEELEGLRRSESVRMSGREVRAKRTSSGPKTSKSFSARKGV